MSKQSTASEVVADLTAVVVSVRHNTPTVLTVTRTPDGRAALPAGPLTAGHRTLQTGLRAWVEMQTGYSLGYVEQLYTFGDRMTGGNAPAGRRSRTLSVAYLALVAEPEENIPPTGQWLDWYTFFPWEDSRRTPTPAVRAVHDAINAWAAAPRGAAGRERQERVKLTFGGDGAVWDEERALERYELLYEAGLVQEAYRDGHGAGAPNWPPSGAPGTEMLSDHRRIVATAMSRLRAKIKYRPVLFELMPPAFTLLQLQKTCEALSGINLHKQNFRRLVLQQGLVEETGEVSSAAGGRPAKLMRFRRDVTAERPAPGLRVRATRRGGYP